MAHLKGQLLLGDHSRLKFWSADASPWRLRCGFGGPFVAPASGGLSCVVDARGGNLVTSIVRHEDRTIDDSTEISAL